MSRNVTSSTPLFDGIRLAWMLSKRDLKNRYASSYIGIAWNIGVPLLYSLINVVVFSILMSGRMGARYGDVPFSLFYFIPFSLWTVFADVVGRSPGILKEYSYLINKIAFPAWIVPLVPLASAFLSQLVLLAIAVFLMVHLGIHPAETAPVYILVWAVWVLMTLGLAYGIAAIAVYIPDLAQAIPVCVTILFWLTPILYPATLVESHGALWVRNVIMDYNPFYYLVEISRHAVFGGIEISWGVLGVMFLLSLFVFSLGLYVFRKLKPGFADVI